MATRWRGLEPIEPEVRTIAHYKREYEVLASGAIVAASADYVAYALRGGMIRVLHPQTDTKALLRGFSKDPCEIRFCPATSDVLAAVANDTNVFVWQLSLFESTVKATVLLQANWGIAMPSTVNDRLCFQPAAAPDVLATSLGGRVIQLWDLTDPATGAGGACLPLILMREDEALPPVTCFDFDPEGMTLVCGDATGGMVAYRLPECDEAFNVTAHQSAVTMLAHCVAKSQLFVSAGDAGYEVKLWLLADWQMTPECIGDLLLEQAHRSFAMVLGTRHLVAAA